MRHLLLFIFLSFSASSFSQEVKLNYSKGSSILFFDLDSKSKLSDRMSLSYNLKNSVFELGYIRSSFSYDQVIVDESQLQQNYKTNTHNLFFSFSNKLGNLDSYSFHLGLEFGYSQFYNYTNLINNRGLVYSDYSFSQWKDLGYYSENNFETSLSDLNIDQLNEYPTAYFSFGPSLECSFKLVEQIEISIKSVYRKNTTDLIDNVNIYNQRAIRAKTNSDDHLDLFLGLRFSINDKASISTFSTEIIDSIVEMDIIEEIEIEEIQPKPLEDKVEIIKTTEDYIYSLFELDSLEASSKEYILSLSQVDSSYSDVDLNVVDNQQQEIVENEIQVEFENEETYFVIVGVFSNKENLKKMSESYALNLDDSFVKNNLYYLYLLKTNSINEARQLRASTDLDCWILKK